MYFTTPRVPRLGRCELLRGVKRGNRPTDESSRDLTDCPWVRPGLVLGLGSPWGPTNPETRSAVRGVPVRAGTVTVELKGGCRVGDRFGSVLDGRRKRVVPGETRSVTGGGGAGRVTDRMARGTSPRVGGKSGDDTVGPVGPDHGRGRRREVGVPGDRRCGSRRRGTKETEGEDEVRS